jgi:hypothetical protein
MSDTTTMTIKLINQPGSTGRGSIVGTDDQRLGVFPEKVGLFEVGKTYAIEFTETDRGGKTLRNVKSAKLVAASPAAQSAAPTAPATNGNGNGNGHKSGNGNGHSAAFRTPEQLFVCEILTAYIGTGKCTNPAELKDTIVKLRDAWRVTFGFDDRIFTPSEAGRHLQAAE